MTYTPSIGGFDYTFYPSPRKRLVKRKQRHSTRRQLRRHVPNSHTLHSRSYVRCLPIRPNKLLTALVPCILRSLSLMLHLRTTTVIISRFASDDYELNLRQLALVAKIEGLLLLNREVNPSTNLRKPTTLNQPRPLTNPRPNHPSGALIYNIKIGDTIPHHRMGINNSLCPHSGFRYDSITPRKLYTPPNYNGNRGSAILD